MRGGKYVTKSILNFVVPNGINICNVGNTPTKNRVREALIDVMLSNMDRCMISDWIIVMPQLNAASVLAKFHRTMEGEVGNRKGCAFKA